MSLTTAILNAILPKKKNKDKSAVIKSLIDTFRYPRRGPGMMWEACAEKIKAMGSDIEMGMKVVGCEYDPSDKLWTVTYEDAEKNRHSIEAAHVISSAPMRQLINGITPRLSDNAVRAANALKYRDFLTVVLILKDRKVFDDNWIYIHDPSVKVGRVQNFKSWSPEMVPDPEMTCYGLEYFCFEGDGLWSAPDHELIERGKLELAKIGLAQPQDIVDACVVRQPKAYPVYDDGYAAHVAVIAQELEADYPNLHLVGRNGMHKYNNQDHAMMTAMLCVQNILAERRVYDLWNVNQDAEYHESGSAGQTTSGATGLRLVPSRVEDVAVVSIGLPQNGQAIPQDSAVLSGS